MKFLCICLSPAIDTTVEMEKWPTDGCVIKNAVDVSAPGGKGLNVARWLAVRGASVACAGLLGEDNAAVFAKELARYSIEDRFMRVPGATRVNEMFVTPQGSFKVNRPAGNGGLADAGELDISFDGFDIVVMSGSLPAGWPADTYMRLAGAAKRTGAQVIIDASGAALVEGVKARPDVIKPNADECEALVGFVPKTPEDFARATAALKESCGYPIISDGGAGCWFDGVFAAAPEVDVLDTTAAGDTLLAEWCWRRFGDAENADGDTGDAARWAVAAGSAACTMPGGEPPPQEIVGELFRNMKGTGGNHA